MTQQIANIISNTIRSEINDLPTYKTATAGNMIKLDIMENPYTISANLKQQYLEKLSCVALNRYPDADARGLVKLLKSSFNIADDNDILLGNGSDELIQLLCLALNKNDVIMSFEPSFAMYELVAKFTQLQYVAMPLDDNYQINLANSLELIAKNKPKIIFIAYPNNPTGNLFNKQDIITIINNTCSLVVLDEAYYAYTDANFLAQLNNAPNLLIMRTVSKIGLAALRLGFLIANKKIITQLNKLRLPFNINSLTQVSAEFFIKNDNEAKMQIKQIIISRDKLIKQLKNIEQLTIYPSDANFVLFKTLDANNLFNYLLKNNVLIKDLSTKKYLTNALRVTVGDEYENKIFINLIKKYYAQ